MKAFLKKFHVTKRVFSYPYVLFMLLFVVVPLVMIFAYAFMDNDHNFTFENFKIFFTSQSSLYVVSRLRILIVNKNVLQNLKRIFHIVANLLHKNSC